MRDFIPRGSHEHDELEPWESPESRRSREAWRGVARREATQPRPSGSDGGSVQIPADLFQRLAAAAARQIEQQLILRRLQREVGELRAELIQLRSESQARSETALLVVQQFDMELENLEHLASSSPIDLPKDFDLGALIDEWT